MVFAWVQGNVKLFVLYLQQNVDLSPQSGMIWDVFLKSDIVGDVRKGG